MERGKIDRGEDSNYNRILFLLEDIFYDVKNDFYILAKDSAVELLSLIHNEINKDKNKS